MESSLQCLDTSSESEYRQNESFSVRISNSEKKRSETSSSENQFIGNVQNDGTSKELNSNRYPHSVEMMKANEYLNLSKRSCKKNTKQ